MPLDPFSLLGVNPDSTDEEIKNAYRLRMSMVHPDKFPSGSSQWQEANRMTLEINDAYQKIKTAEARRVFQASQNPPSRPQPRNPNPSPDRSQWKPAYQVRQEERAKREELANRHEEEIQQIIRERAAEEAAWLAKRPWTREWRKVRHAFEKNKAACIYGAIFLGMGIYMLIRYPSFRSVELLLWFQHQFF